MFTYNSKRFVLPMLGAAVLSLAACGKVESEAKYPTGLDRGQTNEDVYGKRETIFGQDGLGIFGGKKKGASEENGNIGVNSFLWRASLDTVSFMPLASADPFGGVILTDWYTDPSVPNERVKLNVFILGRELKSEGIRVRAFRQVAAKNGWQDAEVAEDTTRKLEDAILARARELRIAKLSGEK